MRFLLKKSFSQINESGKKKAKFQIIQGHGNHIHQVDGFSPNGKVFQIKEKVTRIKNPMEHDDVHRLKERLHNYEPSKNKNSNKPKRVYKLKTVDIRNLLSDALKMVPKKVEIKKKPVKKEPVKKVISKPEEIKKKSAKKQTSKPEQLKKKPLKQKIEIKLKK
jgi:hypothetical protein